VVKTDQWCGGVMCSGDNGLRSRPLRIPRILDGLSALPALGPISFGTNVAGDSLYPSDRMPKRPTTSASDEMAASACTPALGPFLLVLDATEHINVRGVEKLSISRVARHFK
jgi:hypothetical protein